MNSMIRPFLGAVLAAALLTPATAFAVPHWSSPVKVAGPAAEPPGITTPDAFVTPDGRSLAIFGDGVRPSLSTGTVGGTFSAPAPLGSDVSGTSGADAALGANGTLAVAWIAGGTAHVAVGPAGQRGTQTDLPGADVSDVAVAVAPDGTVTVAYRAKPAANSYQLLAATAAPGAAFGAPVTLHTSTQGIDGLDAAAGPDGAVAIAYRRLAPRYRAYAVVRPAGAAAFGEPQALSAGTMTDIQTRIAFAADGTIVAAWTNNGGAAYALRAPGATTFGAPAPLGPGEPTFLLDLAPTPQGGTVAAWSTGSQVKAAIKAPGAGFGDAQNVLPVNSEIAVQPVVTAQPGGPVTVAASDPATGAIIAADVGAGNQTIGYGPVQTGTPLAIASSADRTVVLWRDASGSLSAATRSEQAPAGGGPGAAPAPADKTAPKLTLQAPRRISVTRRTTSIRFYVRCDEPCTLTASGNMRTQRGKRKLVAPLRFFETKKLGAGRRLVTLRLYRSAQNDLRRALTKKRGATVFFDVTAADASHNETRRKGQLALHPAKRKRR
jgi:hypothetical protein